MARGVSQRSDSRIAFLGINQVRNFEIQGEVRLVVLGIACISLKL
jgi:hypothetical protein